MLYFLVAETAAAGRRRTTPTASSPMEGLSAPGSPRPESSLRAADRAVTAPTSPRPASLAASSLGEESALDTAARERKEKAAAEGRRLAQARLLKLREEAAARRAREKEEEAKRKARAEEEEYEKEVAAAEAAALREAMEAEGLELEGGEGLQEKTSAVSAMTRSAVAETTGEGGSNISPPALTRVSDVGLGGDSRGSAGGGGRAPSVGTGRREEPIDVETTATEQKQKVPERVSHAHHSGRNKSPIISGLHHVNSGYFCFYLLWIAV